MYAGPTWLELTCCCPGIMRKEILPNSVTEPHKYACKTPGNKSYAPPVLHVCKVHLVLKRKNVQRSRSSRRSPHKHSHSCPYTQRGLCEANHLWACVYLLPGNESGRLMYTFCIYVCARSRLRSGDKHGVVRWDRKRNKNKVKS